MIKIKQTKLKDYKEIYNLLKAENMLLNNFTKNKFSKMLRRNRNLYFIATDNNKVIGSVFVTYDGGNYVYLYKLIVHKNYRNKGIASLLIKKILDKFKQNKDIWIYCHIHKTNKSSIRVFSKLGFNRRKKHYLFDNSKK